MPYRKPKLWGLTKPPVGRGLDWGDPINYGIAGCWLLNEGAGIRNYDLTKKSHGIITGPTWAPGRSGRSLLFNGTTDYVDLGLLLDQNGPVTISAWINPATVAAGTREIVANGNASASAGDYSLEINRTAAKLSVLYGNTVILTSTTSLVAGRWYHVAMVRSGVAGAWTVTIYLNGVNDGTTATAVNPNGTGESTSIGRHGSYVSGLFFSGNIENVRIYSIGKRPNEIARLYYEPFAGIETPRIRMRETPPAAGVGKPHHYYAQMRGH